MAQLRHRYAGLLQGPVLAALGEGHAVVDTSTRLRAAPGTGQRATPSSTGLLDGFSAWRGGYGGTGGGADVETAAA